MAERLNYSGLAVAGIGFFLTRFTVNLAIYEDPVRFVLAGVLPLALGLGLAAFGMALVVADVPASLVRTTAVWCAIGAGTMLVLVVLTLLGSSGGGPPALSSALSRTYLSNFLIGGSIGGTLTGLYAASNHRHRGELERQANRLEVLNRLLRHEVLNAVTAIRGHVTLGVDGNPDAEQVVEERSDAIVRTIEEVRHLARRPGRGGGPAVAVDLGAALEESVSRVREAYPAVELSLEDHPSELLVRADDRLTRVFTHLLENAAVHAATDRSSVDVTVSAAPETVRVGVRDEGPGLPESQQTLLETGAIEEFDNPARGFGLNVVRLLVEDYGGTIETDVDRSGTTITVVLPRAAADGTTSRPSRRDLGGVRPAVPHLVVTLGAAIVAGVVYGVVAELFGGSVGFIGVYYGIQHTAVGWITHEFHSVVFAFMYAGLVAAAPARYGRGVPAYAAIGVGWSLVLWVVAAGVISPVWLRLVGIPAPVPNLSPMLLPPHVGWGVTLGVLTALGYEHLAPRLAAIGDRPRP